MKTPKEIVQLMMVHDNFSQWMELDVITINKGFCEARCVVKEEMLNGFGILHEGISYSISDSLLAFASNAYGFKCVSIETSISHTRSIKSNETLIARCTEIHRGKTIGIYTVDIYDSVNKLVSKFKGSVLISKDEW